MSGLNMFKNFGFPGTDKLMERMFRRIDNVAWDMMTGKVGVKTADGVFAIDGEGEEATIVGNLFDGMSMPIPAFAQSTSVKDVKVGDLILRGASEQPAWVTEVKEIPSKTAGADPQISFRLLKANGDSGTWKAPKIQMLGFDAGGVMVVRTLMAMLPGGKNDLTNIQGMMLPMLMMGGMDGDGEETGDMMSQMMMMTMFMGQQPGGANVLGAGGPMGGMMQQMMQFKMMEKLMNRGSSSSNKLPNKNHGRGWADDERNPFSKG